MANRIGRFLFVDIDAEYQKKLVSNPYSLWLRCHVSTGDFVQLAVEYPKQIKDKRGERIWVKVESVAEIEGKLVFHGLVNDDVTHGHIHGFVNGSKVEFGTENILRILENE